VWKQGFQFIGENTPMMSGEPGIALCFYHVARLYIIRDSCGERNIQRLIRIL